VAVTSKRGLALWRQAVDFGSSQQSLVVIMVSRSSAKAMTGLG